MTHNSFLERHCAISHLTDLARDAVRELEREDALRRMQELLSACRADPTASYRKRWYPRFVVWELTLACNMRCDHCGSSAGRARPDELTLDEMLRVCDELGALGCERVTLLGGEPLIHPHWRAVARRMRESGYRANVITNGWTLNRPELCDQLAEAGLSIVGVSLDGLEAAHDGLRRRAGSFDRILSGIRLLRERSMPVAVSTVVTAESLADLSALHDLLGTLDVAVWQLQIGNPLGRMHRGDPRLLDPVRLPELLDFVLQHKEAGERPRIDIADNVGYFGPHEDRGIRKKRTGQAYHWTGCHAGIQAMGIDSNGDIKGCQSLPSTPAYVEGNIREKALADIWNDPSAFRYTRHFRLEDLRGACAQCTYGPLCKAGCTSAALAHSGDVGDNPMCVQRALTAHDS